MSVCMCLQNKALTELNKKAGRSEKEQSEEETRAEKLHVLAPDWQKKGHLGCDWLDRAARDTY